MSPSIERIEEAGPDHRARRVVFADGSDDRLTSAGALKAIGIARGDSVDTAALEASLATVEFPLARDRALQLLGYRDRSVAEVKRRLSLDGYPALVVSAVVGRLVELGYLDDERFATAWMRSREASGRGPRRIRRELAQKGVAPETVDAVMASSDSREAQVALAARVIGPDVPRDRRARDRLVRRLVARGFDLSVAYESVRTVDVDAQETEFE